MKNKILATLIVISAFIAGYSINSIAISNTTPEYKIAVVDIATILKNSKEINALKLEQEKQMQNMQATIDKAKAEISKEQDPAKIAQLEEKYRNEINKQKLALDTSYNNKLTAIDNKIKTAVVEKARSMNYNMVLPKNTVLFGGDDITEQVATIIK
ncbi:outer membrane protein [Clostridium sp. CAG:768]|jgi:Skp family chaperone for outer membrane proteins|nr:outer membrane protein [Clostridium sp. CAG:768]